MICSRYLYTNRPFSTILFSESRLPISYRNRIAQACNPWNWYLRPQCTGGVSSSASFRRYSSTPAANVQDVKNEVNETEQDLGQRRKKRRPPAAKTSLKQTALEAQRSLGGTQSQRSSNRDEETRNKVYLYHCLEFRHDHLTGFSIDRRCILRS